MSSGPGSDACPPRPVALVRTERGWSVRSRSGDEPAADLVEGLSLADLVAEELGVLTEPDRMARRSARGHAGAGGDAPDPVHARLAELERTVAQLEHALAARVSTERAIGVLAERHGTSARAAFESLRRDARSHGRPVADVAREVLDGLPDEDGPPATEGRAAHPTPDPAAHAAALVAPVGTPPPRVPTSAVTAVDGVS